MFSIRKHTGVTNFIVKTKQSRRRWAEHVDQRDDNRWIYRMAAKDGKKKKRKSKRRWRDDVTAFVVRLGRGKQKTGVHGKNIKRATFNIG